MRSGKDQSSDFISQVLNEEVSHPQNAIQLFQSLEKAMDEVKMRANLAWAADANIKIKPFNEAFMKFSKALRKAEENSDLLDFDNLNKKFQDAYNSAMKIFKITKESNALSELNLPTLDIMNNKAQQYNQSQKMLSTDEVMNKTKILLDRLGLSEDFSKLNSTLSNHSEMQKSVEYKSDARIKFQTINNTTPIIKDKLLDLLKNNFGDDFNQSQSNQINIEEKNKRLKNEIKNLIEAVQKSEESLNRIASPASHMATPNKFQSGAAIEFATAATTKAAEIVNNNAKQGISSLENEMISTKPFIPSIAVKKYGILINNKLTPFKDQSLESKPAIIEPTRPRSS